MTLRADETSKLLLTRKNVQALERIIDNISIDCWRPTGRTHTAGVNEWKKQTLSPLGAQVKIKYMRTEAKGVLHPCMVNTVAANPQFNVEYVLQEACRPKLDKTGIKLIDEIIIARALSPMSITPWHFSLKLVQFLNETRQIQHNNERPFCKQILKYINCNYYLSLLRFLRPCSGPSGPKSGFPHSPRLRWSQFYFHKMTSNLPNHYKEEWVYSPLLSFYPSIYHPSLPPPPLRTYGCRCADMQPKQCNKRPVMTEWMSHWWQSKIV